MIQIQTTVSGYGGKPCTLFSVYDTDVEVLAIAVDAEYRRERRDGCIVLTNEHHKDLPREWLFSEEDFGASILAFFALKQGVAADGKSTRITFSDRAIRANPENVIEQDGMNESGRKYRISDGITCAQVAALATCSYAIKAGGIGRTVEHAKSYVKLFKSGGILSV